MRQPSIFVLFAAALMLAACSGGDASGTDKASKTPAGDNSGAPTSGDNRAGVETGDLTRALATAKETGKNVLVIYGRETCPYSRQMDEQVLSDATVKAAMTDFVVLRVEQNVNAAEFEKSWGKQPTPTVVTLDAEGKPLGSMLNGVVAKSDFLLYAAWAKTGSGPQPGVATGGG